jgi:predicted Zn-dependent protease with MMP-like domain
LPRALAGGLDHPRERREPHAEIARTDDSNVGIGSSRFCRLRRYPASASRSPASIFSAAAAVEATRGAAGSCDRPIAPSVYDVRVSEDPTARELREAQRLLATGDARAAAQRLRDVVARGPLSPGLEADARYLLGLSLGASGDREGMSAEWAAVLRLDAVAAPPAPLLALEEFESVAEAALAELPQELLDRLGNVAVLIADRPSQEMVADGIDPRVLGLYHGVPMAMRSVSFGAPYADTIHLFRANLERVCATRAGLAERIRVTVLHETAHFFGYSEAQLRRMGLA